MQVHTLAKDLGLIDLAPDSGFENFIGAYVLRSDKIGIVDVGPASALDNLFAGLKESGISPENISYIFVTHIHLDHNGGIGQAMKLMPHAVVIVHEKGRPHLAAPAKLWESSLQTIEDMALMFGKPEPVPESRIVAAYEGMKIDLGNTVIEVLQTPGHASHHLCFWNAQDRRLFTGDAAGVYMKDIDFVRPDMPPPFNLELALSSIDRLISQSPETLCYTHFGCAGHAVDRLRSFKRRLALWGKIIAEHIDRQSDWSAIYEDIKRKDSDFARFDNLPRDRRDGQLSFVKASFAGFISYFKKYGTGVLNQYNLD